MESRFTVKDAFIATLLMLVIAVVGAAMWQYDRQWEDVQLIKKNQIDTRDNLAQLNRQLTSLNARIASGNFASGKPADGPTTAATQTVDGPDPFLRQREASQKADYAVGDWLVQNLNTKLSRITPLLSTDTYASMIQLRVTETLAYRDPETLDWLPLLATGWKIDDNSEAWKTALAERTAAGKSENDAVEDPTMPPALTITFKLRPGVVFSDNEPFTADDLVWTYGFIMTDAVDAARTRSGIKENLKAVQKVDDLTVAYVFKRPYFEAFSLAATLDVLPKHFFEKYSVKAFNESVGLLLGTGPYRLVDPAGWAPGKPMELIRNERYWGMPGPFAKLLYQEIEDDSAYLTMFKNGDFDTFGALPEQYVVLKDDPQINAKADRYEFNALDGGYTYVTWNQVRGGKKTRFSDKRVRQAMTMLIDREALARDVYRGYAQVATGPFSPVNQQNAPEIKPWPYDVERARALLKEAGYEDRNGDGVLESAANEPFRFALTYGNVNPISKQIALAMKDGFARVGIAMDLEPTDWPIMLDKLRKHDYDAITLGWTGGAETDIYQMFHSTQIDGGGDNSSSYRSDALDRAMVAARATVNEAERMKLWQECHRILHEDQPYTFLLVAQRLLFVDKRFANVHKAKTGMNYMNTNAGPIPWYVPLEKQVHTN